METVAKSLEKTNARSFALVTGASGGIGLDIARRLAQQGYNLLLVARSSETLCNIAKQLETNSSIKVLVHAADLSETLGIQSVINFTQEMKLDIEILVNNAGYGVYGKFLETVAQDEAKMLQLNMVALTALTKAYLPNMISRGKGYVLNVASTAAFQPGPGMAAYYASKAYVLSFSEAIGYELRGTGVSVTALCPGPTLTGFQERAQMHGSKLLSKFFLTSSQRVANEGVEAMFLRRRLVIPGLINKIMAMSVRFTPRNMVLLISNFAASR